MSEYKGNPGELVYKYNLNITELVEYGCSADAVFSGQSKPPAEGARFDVHFAGDITGPRIKGIVKGVDYLHIRPMADASSTLRQRSRRRTGKRSHCVQTAWRLPNRARRSFSSGRMRPSQPTTLSTRGST